MSCRLSCFQAFVVLQFLQAELAFIGCSRLCLRYPMHRSFQTILQPAGSKLVCGGEARWRTIGFIPASETLFCGRNAAACTACACAASTAAHLNVAPCAQLNVASDSPAREYEVGVRYNGVFEDDPAFYLFATAGVYHEQDILGLDPESTNWIGFVGIGPKRAGKRDIAIAFRGTQVRSGL